MSYEPVARLDDLPPGTLLAVETAAGEKICLANVDGEIVAVSDTCTHQDFPMSQGTLLPRGVIECAWHGARFDCRSGKVLHMPADEPLPTYRVTVRDGEVFVGERKR
ncbi:MAG: non-heme iron oxygenase ferredoxin subunit [Gemmatimonadaceae bacterium]